MLAVFLLVGVAAEIRAVGTGAFTGCFRTTGLAAIDLSSADCNSEYCPECFLLAGSGSLTYTLQNCPGKSGPTSGPTTFTGGITGCTPGASMGDEASCVGGYVRQYQFINLSGAAATVTDGETTTTPDFSLAGGSSATVMCYNGNFYPIV